MDLHDHVIQELFAVGMGLERLVAVLDDADQAAQVVGQVRSLNNMIGTIRTRIFQLQADRHDPGGLQIRILALADSRTEQDGYPPQLQFAGSIDGCGDAELADDILAVVIARTGSCAPRPLEPRHLIPFGRGAWVLPGRRRILVG